MLRKRKVERNEVLLCEIRKVFMEEVLVEIDEVFGCGIWKIVNSVVFDEESIMI